MTEQVRIVVGEGRAMRRGLLRFVLEGEGYQVVAEATTAAELGRVLAVHRPDLVVLDDGIGAMAVGMTHEMVPDAKIILVWPRAVVPVGGDARVDPSDVLRELGPAVARVSAPAVESGLAAVPPLAERPPWIERVRKDRSALRERLAKATPPPSERPSVTQLQRRGQRLHPLSRKPATEGTGTGEPIIDDTGPAPVVILPPGESKAPKDSDQDDDKTTAAGVVVPIGAAAAAAGGTEAAAGEADAAAGEAAVTGTKDAAKAAGTGAVAAAAAAGAVALGKAARNRRIGAVVLTGAAATTAIVVALVLPNNRLPANVQSEPTNPATAPTTPGGGTVPPTNTPPTTEPSDGPDGPDGGPGGDGPGGDGGHDDGEGPGLYPPVPRYARAAVLGRN